MVTYELPCFMLVDMNSKTKCGNITFNFALAFSCNASGSVLAAKSYYQSALQASPASWAAKKLSLCHPVSSKLVSRLVSYYEI